MKKLKELYDIDSEVEIAYLSENSQEIKPNTLFFALKGATFDGHSVVDQVISDGAVAIVHTDELNNYQEGIVYLKVDDINLAMAQIASKFFNQPSTKFKLTGVTGTNGKTTIAWLLHTILNQLSSSAYIGTIGIEYANKVLTNHFTTPKSIELNAILNDMVEADIDYVNLEVSSHALEQKRSYGLDFDYAIMTNFSSDHENFHGGKENYKKAKQILFDNLKPEAYALLNIDDETYEQYKEATKAQVISYGTSQQADVRAHNIVIKNDSTEFDLILLDEIHHIKTNLVAMFNVYNLLPVLTILHLEGFDMSEISYLLTKLTFPQGRMESIIAGQDYDVIVDYAHTPDGFEKVFEYAKSIKKGRIISVFGSAGGDRNKEKRPVLGSIAAKYSDVIVLTQEDARDESVIDICNDIKQGINESVETITIEKRKDAVEYVINNAKKDDLILILAKANDKYNVVANNQDEPYEGDIDLSLRLIKERLGKENEKTK